TGVSGNFISLSETMNNFVWNSTTLSGGQGAGGCGVAPSVAWAYNTSSSTPSQAGVISTSPVLSLDGSKVAFVENVFSGAVLHVLRWKPSATTTPDGSVLSPATPTRINSTDTDAATNWNACLAGNGSCLFNLPLGSAGDTFASPYYIYPFSSVDPAYADAAYVGDDAGKLWKITGVFNSTPAVAAGWPI